LNKKLRKKLSVKKFIKKKLNGGRLKDDKDPSANIKNDSNKKIFFNLIK
tara:strand:+ start:292 stop:438 length:147 start_codon:yes stop_codon:yes gene_type:complete